MPEEFFSGRREARGVTLSPMPRLPHAAVFAVVVCLTACTGANGATPNPTAPTSVDSSGAAGATTNLAEGGAGAAGGAAPHIDYNLWELQLPIGPSNAPTTISASQLLAGFSDEYFYPAADGGQIFMDPETGSTTSGSQHCRSEMRELALDGSAAAWSSSGSHTLTVSGRVLQLGGGASGLVTVGQLFDGTDSLPLLELQYSSKTAGFQLLYEEAKGAGSTTDLATPVALNTRYRFALSLTEGTARVTINDQTVFTKVPSAALQAKNFYFKFGAYDQTSAAGSPSSTPYTVVETDSAEVVHR